MTETTADPADARPRKRRADGERSRKRDPSRSGSARHRRGYRRALDRATREAVGMSKSGLFAHFGSKQELQIATIETASDLYAELVVDPGARRADRARAAAGARRALPRARRERRLSRAAASSPRSASEMDTHPGPVRDLAVRLTRSGLPSSFSPFATARPRAPSTLRRIPSSSRSSSTRTCCWRMRSTLSCTSRLRSSGPAGPSIAGWPKPRRPYRPRAAFLVVRMSPSCGGEVFAWSSQVPEVPLQILSRRFTASYAHAPT